MDLINLEDAAKSLKISVIQLWRYINSAKIKAEKNGDEYFISKSELDAFMSQPQVIETKTSDADIVQGRRNHRTTMNMPPTKKQPVRHMQIFPGISSTIMETIVTMSQDLNQLSDLKDILSENAKEWLSFVEKIEKEGVTDIPTAMDLLLIDEALKNLNTRRSLFLRLLQGTAIVLLPLPPHLSDTFLGMAQHDLIFNTDRNLPPHLKHFHYPNIDAIPLAQLQNSISGVDAVILEGYIEHDRIYVRDTASNMIYMLGNMELKDIFVHSIPHIPPHARFVELTITRPDVSITSI